MRPIFIGGCERSGTTLLGALLGAHPLHVAVPEMQFKLGLLVGETVREGNAMNRLQASWRFRVWGVEAPTAGRASGVSRRDLVQQLVVAYAAKVGKPHADVWIDHTPANLRFVRTLSQSFPDAGFVHVVRDGRAVAASLLRVDWGPNDAARAARYWAEQVAHGLAAELQEGIETVVRVRYEDVVTKPAATLERLCGRLGIEYSPSMTEGSGFVAPPTSAAIHRLVGSAPDQSRAEAWRRELSPRQIEIFESVASDMLVELGYTPEFGAFASPATMAERLQANIRHVAQTRFNKLRRRRRRSAGLRRLRAGSGA